MVLLSAILVIVLLSFSLLLSTYFNRYFDRERIPRMKIELDILDNELKQGHCI